MAAAYTFDELTPSSFLVRAGEVHGDRLAVIDGERRLTYAELRREWSSDDAPSG